MSFTDLNLYLGNLPPEKSKFYMPSLLKINSGLFNYLSMDSWITLLYQIFKIYVLARVSPKNVKQHLSGLPEVPSHYLQLSNFSSQSESILFFWCEHAVA
jgi:phosphatidylserine synthase